jgi:hypothetical protein
MNSADRISVERQLQVPLRRALLGQGRTTVASAARRCYRDGVRGFSIAVTNATRPPWADMKESLYARRPNYRRSRARVALF